MKIIKVNSIEMTEKDIIEVDSLKDFERINIEIFKDTFVLDLKGVYYLMGTDVTYIYKKIK